MKTLEFQLYQEVRHVRKSLKPLNIIRTNLSTNTGGYREHSDFSAEFSDWFFSLAAQNLSKPEEELLSRIKPQVMFAIGDEGGRSEALSAVEFVVSCIEECLEPSKQK